VLVSEVYLNDIRDAAKDILGLLAAGLDHLQHHTMEMPPIFGATYSSQHTIWFRRFFAGPSTNLKGSRVKGRREPLSIWRS
jgi:hypothetical protein